MLNKIYDYPVLVLLVTSILLFFFNLADLPISIMEARNFNVAREMLTEGNWLLTTMNDVPRYEKPPFPAWFSTPFIQFDINSVVLNRLPTSIMATLGVLLSYYLFKVLSASKKLALIAGLILGTSLYYIAIRFEAPSDTYTHVAMIGGLLFMVKALQAAKLKFWYALLAILGFAISVLSKGPVSLYALFLPFIIAYWITYKSTLRHKVLTLVLLILGTVLGASWYLYVRLENPEVFLEIANEETNNWSSYNVRPFYYYWSFFIQSGIWTIPAFLSLIYPYFKTKVKNKKLYLFSWLWTIGVVILLSIIPEKKSRYLVPVLFPLALNIAQILVYQFKTKKLDELSKYMMKFHYLILFLIGISVVTLPYFIELKTTEFWIWYYVLIILMFGVSVLIFFNFSPLKPKKLFLSNIFLIVIITSIGTYGIKFLKKNENYKTLASFQIENPLYYYHGIRPEVIWESGTKSKPFKISKTPNVKEQIQVIVNKNTAQEFEDRIEKKYTVLSIDSFDRNYFKERDDRKFRDRYVIFIYTIQTKSNTE
ncbi:ArnT family glycosyltransferase [Psychroflexus salinarum]|uniref:ArnT family glycosyltransferase n=1 Tax=Psychroflexus salinarum TaxID=546024 RepID=A0ABW3GVN5_9FLAO